MEIIIERNDLSYLVPQEKFVWENYIRSKIAFNLALAITGILFVLDVIDRYSKTGNFTGSSFTIGLGIIISIVINTIYLLYDKYKSIRYTSNLCKKGSQHQESSTITITEWGLRVKAITYNFEFPWNYFHDYTAKKTSF